MYSGRRWTRASEGVRDPRSRRSAPDLLDELEHLTAVEVPAETVLKGVLPDQSALFGVLARLPRISGSKNSSKCDNWATCEGPIVTGFCVAGSSVQGRLARPYGQPWPASMPRSGRVTA